MAKGDYKVVDEGVIEVRYKIFSYEYADGSVSYDWQAGNGDEADELFDSIEAAEADVYNHYA